MNDDATLITSNTASIPTAAIGHLVAGRYRLDALIRRGTLGSVWRATDNADGSRVAVKLIRSGRRFETRARARFEREATLLSQLVHPNVVRLLDWGVAAEHQWYLVLELLEGRSLSARLGEGRVRSSEVRALGLQVLQGLSEAHALGIVHGDVSPENIILTETGAKLIDWAVAIRRCPGQDEDVQAVGQLLFEALVGQPPGPDKPVPRRDNTTLMGPLVDLILAMLDGDPAKRPSTPEALEKLAAMPSPYVYRVT